MTKNHHREWRRPTRRGACLACGIVLLYLSSGYWWLAMGNGRTIDVRLGAGALNINWGHEPDIYEKITCAKGIECGLIGFFYLPVARPWVLFYGGPSVFQAEIPLWLVAPPLAVLALVLSCRRRVDAPRNACRGCGYDLTGNVSGRCPECGAAATGREVRGRADA